MLQRFICQLCGKDFGEFSHNLKTHVRTVHLQEKQYNCDICGQKFGTNGNMRRHKLVRHGATCLKQT